MLKCSLTCIYATLQKPFCRCQQYGHTITKHPKMIMIQLNKMPPPPNHKACQTPNPPWWCGNAPEATIDSGLWILLAIGLIIGIIIINKNEKLR